METVTVIVFGWIVLIASSKEKASSIIIIITIGRLKITATHWPIFHSSDEIRVFHVPREWSHLEKCLNRNTFVILMNSRWLLGFSPFIISNSTAHPLHSNLMIPKPRNFIRWIVVERPINTNYNLIKWKIENHYRDVQQQTKNTNNNNLCVRCSWLMLFGYPSGWLLASRPCSAYNLFRSGVTFLCSCQLLAAGDDDYCCCCC